MDLLTITKKIPQKLFKNYSKNYSIFGTMTTLQPQIMQFESFSDAIETGGHTFY